jgi:hypothetical protein
MRGVRARQQDGGEKRAKLGSEAPREPWRPTVPLPDPKPSTIVQSG